jgi:hypothetical protein
MWSFDGMQNKSRRTATRLAAGVLSCCAVLPSASAETNASLASVVVPIRIRHGDLLVETRINRSEPLEFKLDTGFGVSIINPKRAESLQLERVGHMGIIGIAGEEQAETYKGAVFDFHGKTYEARRIAALPSEGQRHWRRRDGILGAGFFKRFVVELDVPRKQMTLWEPEQFTYQGKGDIIPIRFKRDTPIIDAEIVSEGAQAIKAAFEIDTGCDGCICLGHDFVTANHLLEGADAAGKDARTGVGGSAEIRSGSLAELRMGKAVIKKPSVNFFLEGSPAGQGQAGHIGLEVLQNYRVTFDYSRLRMILEPTMTQSK